MKLPFGLAGLATLLALVPFWPVGLAGQQSPAPASAAGSAAAGAPLYQLYCAGCHGANLAPAESAFDLRYLAPSDKQRFVNSVARGKDSMPAWSALLTPQQIEAVWDYVLSRKTEVAAAMPVADAATPAAAPPSQAWPCGGDARLLVDGAGSPVWIASDELMSHAISTPPPAPAVGSAPAGSLTVDVLIDAQGRVKCARAAPVRAQDVPAATSSAVLDAVRQWAFRPFAAGGQPVAIYGHLQLNLEPR
jgi:mono/diheme cytochrome c family protein